MFERVEQLLLLGRVNRKLVQLNIFIEGPE